MGVWKLSPVAGYPMCAVIAGGIMAGNPMCAIRVGHITGA